jgi:hypothetical protein
LSRGLGFKTLEDIVGFILANRLGNLQQKAVIDWVVKNRGITKRAVQYAILELRQAGVLKKEITDAWYANVSGNYKSKMISFLIIDIGEVEERHNELKLELFKKRISVLPEKERAGLILLKRAELHREWAEKDREIKQLIEWSAQRLRKWSALPEGIHRDNEIKKEIVTREYLWQVEVEIVMEYLKSWKGKGSS